MPQLLVAFFSSLSWWCATVLFGIIKPQQEVVLMKLSEKILYYRKAAKLSQEELAVRVGVSRQAVSKWELGDATPEVDKLLALARIFGVTTDELLSESAPAGSPEQAESSSHIESDAPSEDGVDRATGLVGRFIQKYSWLAGVYVLLSGLGITITGALARRGFGTMLGAVMDGFGGGVSYSGPPELKDEVLGQLGAGAANSLFGGMGGFALDFANVIIVIGVVMMIAGAVLVVILYRKGNKRP